jgi:hypothetical protein
VPVERRTVWECIGCGRIEDSRPCVGICQDRKAEYVLASEHDAALAALVRVVRTIALTTPREGECLRHWRALQEQAHKALESIGEANP